MRLSCELGILLISLAGFSAHTEEPAPRAPSRPLIVKLNQSIAALLKEAYPEAIIHVMPDELTAQAAVQKFMIHDVQMTGEVSAEARETMGPSFKGIMLEVAIRHGKYDGQAVVPQTLNKPYWHVFINVYPLENNEYIWLSLAYGSRVRDDFIDKVRHAVADAAKP